MNNSGFMRVARAGCLALFGLVFAAVGARAVQADDTAGFGPPEKGGNMEVRMERRMQKMDEKLGLTDAQKKQLTEQRKTHRGETKKLRDEKRLKMDALRAELEKPDFSADNAKTINGDLKVIENKMADKRLEGILAVRKIMTPEQYKKFQELTSKKWKKGGQQQGGKHGKGMRGQNGPMGPGGSDGQECPDGPGGPGEPPKPEESPSK